MKRIAGVFALSLIALVATIAVVGHFAQPAKAQATLVSWSFIQVADAASCKPTGLTTLCATTNSPQVVLISVNSNPVFSQLFPAQAGGNPVTSVYGRTGAVVSGQGDVAYSQLSSPPTKINCPTASLTQSGLVAGTCTIN